MATILLLDNLNVVSLLHSETHFLSKLEVYYSFNHQAKVSIKTDAIILSDCCFSTFSTLKWLQPQEPELNSNGSDCSFIYQELSAEKSKVASVETRLSSQLSKREQEMIALQARMQASYQDHVAQTQRLNAKVGSINFANSFSQDPMLDPPLSKQLVLEVLLLCS